MRLISTAAITFIATGLLAKAPPADLDRRLAHDREVVAAVLDDLATYRGEDSPMHGPFGPDPLTLDPTPYQYGSIVDGLPRQYDPRAWSDLLATARPKLKEAAQDFVRRIKGPKHRFTAGSPLVPLYEGSDPSKLSPFQHRKAPVQLSLPGYSRDRRLALLTLSIPWSIHRCHGTYVVARDQETWDVRVRDFTCVV